MDPMEETTPPSSLEKNPSPIKTMPLPTTKSRYLIVCSTQEKYLAAKTALVDFPNLVIEMNNYDGTSDFIVECSESSADLLKTKGLDMKADKAIRFKTVENV
jgi:hypothetical protein